MMLALKNACGSSGTTGQMATFTVYNRSVITSHLISFLILKMEKVELAD